MESAILNRILGIDYGIRRIGLALSDPLNIIARPLSFLDRKEVTDIYSSLKAIIEKNNVSQLVIGLPLNMKGGDSAQTKLTREFAAQLKQNVDIPVMFQDERLSSVTAEKSLIQQERSPSKNKGMVDQTAAAVFLQEYLDSKK